MGGKSAEREVSLRSGDQVARALESRGHDVKAVDLDLETWNTLRDGRFECVFNSLHGRLGEDGTVQGMLELLGLPYTGSGVLASALCMDKARAGSVMSGAGLRVPEFEELEVKEGVASEVVDRVVAKLGLPLVVKPVREGSTIGLTIAQDEDEVASGLLLAGRYDRQREPGVRLRRQVHGRPLAPHHPGSDSCDRSAGRCRRRGARIHGAGVLGHGPGRHDR
jgi:D-alanine-D-alanine ligase